MSRREALRQLGAAGAGVALAGGVQRGQSSPIVIAGRTVEIVIAAVSPSTVRVSALPIGETSTAPLPNDGALVAAANGRDLGRRRAAFAPVRAGDFVVRFTGDPPAFEIQTEKGEPIQRLALDTEAPTISFSLGKGPLLGMGEGGPQFDRKGFVYTNRNGQGGYQLRTHGGRVPIQWLVSTDGWGLYIHRPLGAFDLTGPNGVLTPADPPCRSTSSSPRPRIPRRSSASTRASPDLRSFRRCGPSATCSRIARSPARTR
jgi:alpha-glucosidase/alpha-D-xyloside xylohydrolase